MVEARVAGPARTSASVKAASGLVAAGWLPPCGSLHRFAVFIDVLLDRMVVQLEISEHARINVPKRRRAFVASQAKAHLEHCRAKEPILERLRLGHRSSALLLLLFCHSRCLPGQRGRPLRREHNSPIAA